MVSKGGAIVTIGGFIQFNFVIFDRGGFELFGNALFDLAGSLSDFQESFMGLFRFYYA